MLKEYKDQKNITINTDSFLSDLKKIFINDILNVTTKFTKKTNLNDENYLNNLTEEDLFIRYFTFKIKFPELKKRKVIFLNECEYLNLPKKEKKALLKIKKIFENGDNFYPYLSKYYLQDEKYNKNIIKEKLLSNYDIMLFKTGIYHLHLNNGYDNFGFVNRGNYLLFCIIFDNNVYFLNIQNHFYGDKEWCEKIENDLIKIIENNLAQYKDIQNKYKKLLHINYNFDILKNNDYSEEEKYKLLKKGYTIFLRGIFDLGVARDGQLNIAIENTINLKLIIMHIKEKIEENKRKIYIFIKETNKNNINSNLIFSISKNGKWLLITENNNDIIIFKIKLVYNIFDVLINYEIFKNNN